MMVSTRGRYALRMMLDLAEHKEDGYVSLKDVCERQCISKKYLEQIIPVLNRSGMLATTRGYQGGYKLVKEPSEYTLGEILRATEGNMAPVGCLEGEVNLCPRKDACPTLPIWVGLQKTVDDYLNGFTLQDLLNQKNSSQE